MAYLSQGYVGVEASTSFIEFWDLYSKVDTETVFNKGKVKFKDNQDLYIQGQALTNEYINRIAK